MVTMHKYYSAFPILLLLQWIGYNDASPCLFILNIHANGMQQQLQVESWGSDSNRIRLSPDVILQTSIGTIGHNWVIENLTPHVGQIYHK